MKKYIDLSKSVENGMPKYSVLPKVKINKIRSIEKDGDEIRTIFIPSHIGTHIDAPSHQIKGGLTLDKIPVEKLVGEAVILDFSDKFNSKNKLITLTDFEKYKGKVKNKDIVIINTGSHKHPVSFTEFPFIDVAVAKWLVNKDISLLGVDTPSVDLNIPAGEKMPVHQVILGAGIPIVEELTNLEMIGRERFFFMCLPIKIKGGDGVNCRAVALIE